MLSIADGNRTLNIYYKGATSRCSTLFYKENYRDRAYCVYDSYFKAIITALSGDSNQ